MRMLVLFVLGLSGLAAGVLLFPPLRAEAEKVLFQERKPSEATAQDAGQPAAEAPASTAAAANKVRETPAHPVGGGAEESPACAPSSASHGPQSVSSSAPEAVPAPPTTQETPPPASPPASTQPAQLGAPKAQPRGYGVPPMGLTQLQLAAAGRTTVGAFPPRWPQPGRPFV